MYSIGTPQNSWNYHERCQTGSSMDTMCRCEVIRPPRNYNRGYGIMRQQDSVKAMQHSIRKTLSVLSGNPLSLLFTVLSNEICLFSNRHQKNKSIPRCVHRTSPGHLIYPCPSHIRWARACSRPPHGPHLPLPLSYPVDTGMLGRIERVHLTLVLTLTKQRYRCQCGLQYIFN